MGIRRQKAGIKVENKKKSKIRLFYPEREGWEGRSSGKRMIGGQEEWEVKTKKGKRKNVRKTRIMGSQNEEGK